MGSSELRHQTVVNHIVDEGSDDRRIDNLLISLLKGVPKSHVYRLIRSGQVRVNSGRVKPNHRIKLGDRIRIPPVRTKASGGTEKVSEKLKAAAEQVLYEDKFILVIDKPSAITVHSGTRHSMGLIEALRNLRKDISSIELVHRLDKATSGILLLAKDKATLRKIHALWKLDSSQSSLQKIYVALLQGQCHWNSKLVETDDFKNDIRLTNYKYKNRNELSHFITAKQYRDCSLVDIHLLTGKTHQARRHALQIGHPIAGDKKFGSNEFNRQMSTLGLKRMFLHAKCLTIKHPVNGNLIRIESPLPIELKNVLDQL